jgi:hypothetical protein
MKRATNSLKHFFLFCRQMKYLAVVVLLFLSYGLFVQAEQQASDSNDEIPSKMGSSIIRPPPIPPRPSPTIYLPGMVINTNSFNLHTRYCFCFRFKCHGKQAIILCLCSKLTTIFLMQFSGADPGFF